MPRKPHKPVRFDGEEEFKAEFGVYKSEAYRAIASLRQEEASRLLYRLYFDVKLEGWTCKTRKTFLEYALTLLDEASTYLSKAGYRTGWGHDIATQIVKTLINEPEYAENRLVLEYELLNAAFACTNANIVAEGMDAVLGGLRKQIAEAGLGTHLKDWKA